MEKEKFLEEINQKLLEAQEFLIELEKHIDKNLYIDGRTLPQWKRYFEIDIPDDVNPAVLIRLSAEIFKKYQVAANYRDRENIQMTILEQSKFERYHEAYINAQEQNKKQYGKPLAADSCKAVATVATLQIETIILNKKVIKDFWSKMCETLVELRKLLELMGYAITADSKAQRDLVFMRNKEQ